MIAGTLARVSTLLIAVGRPHRPRTDGYGGRGDGLPRRPSIEAINAVTDGKAAQIVRKLFNAEIDQLNSAQTLAMFEWIKPAKQTPTGQPPTMLPANINAAAELAALLSEVKPQS